MIGVICGTFLPATTITRSEKPCSKSMVAPRKVFATGVPSATGGQGSSALSRPMRLEKPADRITPQMLGESAIARRYQRAVQRASDVEHVYGFVSSFAARLGRSTIQ